MKHQLLHGRHIQATVPFDMIEDADETALRGIAAEHNIPLPPERQLSRLSDQERRDKIFATVREHETVYHAQVNPVVECDADLSARWPTKFSRVNEAQVANLHPASRIPGETQEAYHQRMTDLINQISTVLVGGVGAPTVASVPPAQPVRPVVPKQTALQTSHDLATIEAMTEAELRKFAAEEEIELPPGAKGKAEVLRVVKAAYGVKG